MQELNNAPIIEGEIDLNELIHKLLKERKLIIRAVLIAVVLGLVIAFSIPKYYTVKTTLAPEFASRSMNTLSQYLSMGGYNLARQASADAVYPDFYPELVASTPFITELFTVPVEFSYKKEVCQTDYYTYLKEYSKRPWWSVAISAPFKALSWFVGLFKEDVEEDAEGAYLSADPSALSFEQSGIATSIKRNIVVEIDKKTYAISISVKSQSPTVSKTIAEEVIKNLQKSIRAYRTEKARADLTYYQQLYDEAKADYYNAQQEFAEYIDANQGVVRQRVLTERSRLQDEMQLCYNLYTACSQQLQTAKAKVQQETPVCAVINPPTLPTRKSGPSKVKILFVFIFLAFVGSASWVLWGRDWLRKFKLSGEQDYNQSC